MLKVGPAMHPVSAISPKPRFEIDMLAIVSPIELPQVSTVRPSKVDGNRVIIPKSSNSSTITSHKIYSQIMLIKNAPSWKMAIIFSGGAVVLWVRNLIEIPIETLTRNDI